MTQITVIGTSENDQQEYLDQAYQLGSLLARSEITLVCGGLTGVMMEASRGAFERGGDVIGILPTTDPSDANPWVTHVAATGISHARNLSVVASADAVIAIGGHWGTLSEIAFARKLGLPVICLGEWQISFPAGHQSGLLYADSPEEALELAEKHALRRSRSVSKTERVDDKLDS